MTGFTAADSLHRLLKQALDSGIAASLADAEAMYRSLPSFLNASGTASIVCRTRRGC